jgi:hypothetical protein
LGLGPENGPKYTLKKSTALLSISRKFSKVENFRNFAPKTKNCGET